MDRQRQDETVSARISPQWLRMASAVVIALVFCVLMGTTLLWAAPAQQSTPATGGDEYIEQIGVIVERPEEKIGTWVISDTEEMTYTATDETFVEGELGVGACALVKSSVAEPDVALKIIAKDPSHCDDDDDDGGGDDGGDEYIEKIGVVVERPEETSGTWVILGDEEMTYTATDETVVEGELGLGACVLVKSSQAEPDVALKIFAKEAEHCDDGDDDDGGDEYIERIGVIVERPEEKIGTWVISDTEEMTYTATDETYVEGELGVGACALVKSSQAEPDVALKIIAKDAYHCADDDDGNDDDGDDELSSKYGKLLDRPVEKVGEWVIGDTTYNVVEETILEGDLEIGACVEVYTHESDPSTAVKIEAKDAFKCEGDDDDDDDHGDDDYLVRVGRVLTRPVGTEGQWVIGGVTYTGTASTELDEEHGALVVGICAKVKVLESSPLIAKEIESVHNYKCGADDDDDDDDGEEGARGVVFGVIKTLPADLNNGIWQVGGMSFIVSPTTQLIDKGGVFTPGVTVKVEFTSNLSDTLYAHRITVVFGFNNPCREHNHDDDDDDGDDDTASVSHNGGGDDDRGKGHRHYGYCPGNEGKAMGLINDRPEGTLLGEWMIGGIPYMTNANTKFHGSDDFLVGERVKVEYVVLSENLRLATKIKEIGGHGGIDPNHSLIVGYVDAKPEAFVGPWTINDAPFVAISTTIFIERGSLFAVGAYVVVEYEIVNDERVIVKILTYVPPGAGDENKVGKLEAIGGVSIASADAELQNSQIWTVDGVDYIVSEATQIVEGDDEVAVGALVYVNSYTEDGQRYATMIRTQQGRMYLPQAGR